MTENSSVCGQKTEVYSRVVGYFRPINGWNPGKKEEFKDRKTFGLSSSYIARLEAKVDATEELKKADCIPNPEIAKIEKSPEGGGEGRLYTPLNLAYTK